MFALLLSNRLNFVTSAVVCKGKLCSFIVSSKFAIGGAMFCKSTDKTDMISRWLAFSTSTLLIKLSNQGIILSRTTEINSEVRLELLSAYLEQVLAYWFVHVVLLISWRIQLLPLTDFLTTFRLFTSHLLDWLLWSASPSQLTFEDNDPVKYDSEILLS